MGNKKKSKGILPIKPKTTSGNKPAALGGVQKAKPARVAGAAAAAAAAAGKHGKHSKRGAAGKGGDAAAFSLSRWLDDYGAVSAAVERHGDLEELLDQNGGLVKIRNFLPPAAAAGLLALLRRLPPSAWNDTSAARDYAHNDISHAFESTKEAGAAAAGGPLGAELAKAFRALSLLQPGALFTFSAARYTRGHHIEPHDDRAYTNVLMDDGEVVECSRRIAAILYLTPDWQEEWGGHLIDIEADHQVHVPEFNSLVAFRIPRWHAVTPVTSDSPRYSIFGWFLEPGRLYDLQLSNGAAGGGGGGAEEGSSDDGSDEEGSRGSSGEGTSEDEGGRGGGGGGRRRAAGGGKGGRGAAGHKGRLRAALTGGGGAHGAEGLEGRAKQQHASKRKRRRREEEAGGGGGGGGGAAPPGAAVGGRKKKSISKGKGKAAGSGGRL